MSAPKKIIKKGELLFTEGEKSEAMFFVNSGNLRLFKKKGTSSIELGVIHKGEIIGEMGFLDGGPRSASAEAITDTELSEINAPNMTEQLKTLPQWLMVLLKSVVNRLRSANNKIRQLEAATTTLSYKSDGSVKSEYEFLNTHDTLKICLATLLAGSRHSEQVTLVDGTKAFKCNMNRIIKYSNQVLSIHVSKITELMNIFERANIAKIDRSNSEKIEVYFNDIDQIESLLNFISEENQKEASKQIHLSLRSVVVMGFIVKHLNSFPTNAEGFSNVNLAQIIQFEKNNLGGKEPFRVDEINELIQFKLATAVSMKDQATITTFVPTNDILKMFKIQKIIKELEMLNEKKREQALKAK